MPAPGVAGQGCWQQASVETDPRFKYRQVTHEPPRASKKMVPNSSHSPRSSHEKIWEANCPFCRDNFLLQSPPDSQSDAWDATSHPTATTFPGPSPFCPLDKAQDSGLQGIPALLQGSHRDSLSPSWSFDPSQPIAPHLAFPVHSHPSSCPFRLLSTDFLARPELEDSNTGPCAELVPNTFCTDFKSQKIKT